MVGFGCKPGPVQSSSGMWLVVMVMVYVVYIPGTWYVVATSYKVQYGKNTIYTITRYHIYHQQITGKLSVNYWKKHGKA